MILIIAYFRGNLITMFYFLQPNSVSKSRCTRVGRRWHTQTRRNECRDFSWTYGMVGVAPSCRRGQPDGAVAFRGEMQPWPANSRVGEELGTYTPCPHSVPALYVTRGSHQLN